MYQTRITMDVSQSICETINFSQSKIEHVFEVFNAKSSMSQEKRIDLIN